jgi:hypothetical protein
MADGLWHGVIGLLAKDMHFMAHGQLLCNGNGITLGAASGAREVSGQ